MFNIIKKINIWQTILVVAVVSGLGLRLYGLGSSGIFFYDEALYLNHTLPALELIQRNPPAGFNEGLKAFLFYLQWPLNFSKPIWLFIIDSRFLFTHLTDWDYAKYAACLFGVLTLPLTFIFARRLFDSLKIACLATAILAILPAHVFYSRVGLQEACSVFLVLAGFYFYLLPRDFGKRTFLAGLFLGLAFLANYRLIILPALLVSTELWFGLLQKEGMRWRHLVWACLTFLAVMVIVGSLMNGAHTRFVFAWIFHQGDMAAQKSSWLEFFAYPYYLFRLENWILAMSFLGSVYLLFKKNWKMAWPFAVSCLQMLIFSMASDRGARYIAIVLPFIAMAVACVIHVLDEKIEFKGKRLVLSILVLLMFAGLIGRSIQLAGSSSDHARAVEFMSRTGKQVKFVASQHQVERLYLAEHANAQPIPEDFLVLRKFYDKGVRYLALDPQAYISFSNNEHKWGLPLKGYLGFIDTNVRPVKVFTHFNRAVMERFVFEHSDDLAQSIRFLNAPAQDLARMSTLRVYDLSTTVPFLSAVMQKSQHK